MLTFTQKHGDHVTVTLIHSHDSHNVDAILLEMVCAFATFAQRHQTIIIIIIANRQSYNSIIFE